MLWLVGIIILTIVGIYYLVPWIQKCMAEKRSELDDKSEKEKKEDGSTTSLVEDGSTTSLVEDGSTTSLVEGWANYRTPYYDYARTGNDPLIFYAKPIYRKPYRWPFTFYKSYPYPHMSYYELS